MMENIASCLAPVSAEYGTFKKLDSSRKPPNKLKKSGTEIHMELK